jgi:drug/metabolite transporter (DMT)-like permease
MTSIEPRHRRRRTAAAVLTFFAAAGAALASAPALGIGLCLVAMIGAGALAASAARLGQRADARPRHLRTAVVVGALAYLVGLPVFWLGGQHVDELVGEADTLWRIVFFATAMSGFVLGYAAVSSRRPTREGR